MMCQPDESDLDHAVRQAVAEARAAGHEGEALVDAAVTTVAAVWAHLDRAVIRAAVVRRLTTDEAPGSG